MEIRDLGASGPWTARAGSSNSPVRTHDGLTLQRVLVELLKRFPKEPLGSDLSASEAITRMEERLREVPKINTKSMPADVSVSEICQSGTFGMLTDPSHTVPSTFSAF